MTRHDPVMAVDQDRNYVPECLNASGDIPNLPFAVLPRIFGVEAQQAQCHIYNGETTERDNFRHRSLPCHGSENSAAVGSVSNR